MRGVVGTDKCWKKCEREEDHEVDELSFSYLILEMGGRLAKTSLHHFQVLSSYHHTTAFDQTIEILIPLPLHTIPLSSPQRNNTTTPS